MIAAAVPTAARAEDATGAWTLDSSILLYGEQERTDVLEPVARITRLFASGHRVSGQVAYDAISGASPSGALPSGQLQTTTTPSGNTATIAAGEIPTITFRDQRFAIDGEWEAPLASGLTSKLGAHYSTETDYMSLGASASVSYEIMNRLTTLTAGLGYNGDEVFPIGGTRDGLSDGAVTVQGLRNPKTVTSGMLGVSRVLTRRWLIGLAGTLQGEDGYLTDPYKVVSLVDSTTLEVGGQLTEKRPDTRRRASLLFSSTYHMSEDVLYVSLRGYDDDWAIRSGTADLRLRHQLGPDSYLQPHLRYYAQTAADFYVLGLIAGQPLPAYASSDYRLGPLRTATLGLTYGFHLSGLPGQVSLRAEYLRQWLAVGGGEDGDEPEDDDEPDDDRDRAGPVTTAAVDPVTIQTKAPALNIGSLLIGYTVHF
jgi:hypothetical protein